MHKKGLLFLILVILSLRAWSNDSVEAAVTGNIVFEKAPELIMQDETLTIKKSASKNLNEEKFSINVDFHFKNISDHDVTRKIVFVLPPVQCRMDANSMWRGLDTNGDDQIYNQGLKDFTTTVDGKPQSFTTRREAMLGERNITNLLNELQIPLNPCKIQTTTNGEADPRYSLNLQKHHLLTEANDAAWSENIYFEWTQTFPAGKTINIQHHYTPSIGASVLSARTIEELNDQFTKSTPPQITLWNRNPATLSQSNPAIIYTKNDLDAGGKQKRFCVMPKWIQYQLTTGANWNGGIGNFKLIINDENDAPFAVNKFYNDNGVHVAKDGNTMSFEIKNFVPTNNLYILFLSLPKSTEDLQACGI